MNLWRRDFLLLVTLAGAAATPAWGQLAAPSVRPAGGAASIPDFSGIWAHPGLGFENPLSGPGPVRNKSRLTSGASNFNRLVGDYSNPILKPHAAEIVRKFGEISTALYIRRIDSHSSRGVSRTPSRLGHRSKSHCCVSTPIGTIRRCTN